MITDERVRVALAAQDRKVNELEKYPICENYSRLEIDTEGMRAALTAFLSSVGGEPVAYRIIDPSNDPRLHGKWFDVATSGKPPSPDDCVPPYTVQLAYTAEAFSARVAGGGQKPFAHVLIDKTGRAVDWAQYSDDGGYVFTVADIERENRQMPGRAPHTAKLVYDHPATARAGVDWQPIESAPKDGTVVDIWHPEFGRLVDQWFDREDGWYGVPDGATHWMPPPGAPVIDQQGADHG